MPRVQDIASTGAPLTPPEGRGEAGGESVRTRFQRASGSLEKSRCKCLEGESLEPAMNPQKVWEKLWKTGLWRAPGQQDIGLESTLPKNLCNIWQVFIFQ